MIIIKKKKKKNVGMYEGTVFAVILTVDPSHRKLLRAVMFSILTKFKLKA